MTIARMLCIVSGMAVAGAILLTLDTTFQGVFHEPVSASFARLIDRIMGSSPRSVVRALLITVGSLIIVVGGFLGNCSYLLLRKLLTKLAKN